MRQYHYIWYLTSTLQGPWFSLSVMDMKSASLRSMLRKRRSVLTKSNQDGSVTVIDLKEMSICYTIDGLAAKAWVLIDGKSSLKHISSRLVDAGRSKHAVKSQLKKFADELKKLGLITLINP